MQCRRVIEADGDGGASPPCSTSKFMKYQACLFFCRGCGGTHQVPFDNSTGLNWSFNGNKEKPTFTPSLLNTWSANPEAKEEFKEWRKERRCHLFIVDGMIQYLSDCTHELAGQTIPMEEIEFLVE